ASSTSCRDCAALGFSRSVHRNLARRMARPAPADPLLCCAAGTDLHGVTAAAPCSRRSQQKVFGAAGPIQRRQVRKGPTRVDGAAGVGGMPVAEDGSRSRHSRRTLPTRRSAYALPAARAPGALISRTVSERKTSSKSRVNCCHGHGSRTRPDTFLIKVDQQVARL